MKCPVCKHDNYKVLDLHADGFYEDIKECKVCGTVWAISHGTVEVIKDLNKNSFLEATSECVESDDYILAV